MAKKDGTLQVGLNAEMLNGYKLYSSVEDIGLTPETVTLESIPYNMDMKSILIITIESRFTKIAFPANYYTQGLLQVIKNDMSRVVYHYYVDRSPLYYTGIFHLYNDPQFSGWSRVYNDLADICPRNDNAHDLGYASLRWRNAYLSVAPIIGSDSRIKTKIESIDEKIIDFIMSLNPVSYELTDTGKDEQERRTHCGLIAQEVEKALYDNGLNTLDFAGFINSPVTQLVQEIDANGNLVFDEVEQQDEYGVTHETKIPRMKTVIVSSVYGLRYEEFIAPMLAMIQNQQRDISDLRNQIAALS